MKELKFEGVHVQGEIEGKIAGSREITIQKISMQGMLFETTATLNMNRQYTFRLEHKEKNIELKAKVMSLLLRRTVEINGKTLPLSQVVVQYEKLAEKEESFLSDVIENILDHDMPNLLNGKNEIRGSKFRAED